MADRKNARQEAKTLERIVPTEGQVEPSAQLKAVPVACNPFLSDPSPRINVRLRSRYGPVTYRTWVWSSAVTRRDDVNKKNLGDRTSSDSNRK